MYNPEKLESITSQTIQTKPHHLLGLDAIWSLHISPGL